MLISVNPILMPSRPRLLELWTLTYCPSVCLCVCTCGWGIEGESIWACTQVSICALFVCHSPLNCNCPAGMIFHSAETNRHASTSPTWVISYHYVFKGLHYSADDTWILLLWTCFPVGTSNILTRLTYRYFEWEVSPSCHIPPCGFL